jgi:hypothetical protein
MALEIFTGSVKEAKEHLMKKALERFSRAQMLPCGHRPDIESCFDYHKESGIVSFYFNIKGERTTRAEAVKIR